MKEKVVFHSIDLKQLEKILKTDFQKGLTEEEAKRRLKKYGENVIEREKRLSSFKIFISQFRSPLIYILLFAGFVTLLLKKYTDSIVIFSAVFINAFFGFFEERKVSQVLNKLKKALKTKALVVREGEVKEIYQEEVVVGDIIILKPGDKVPADARLIEAKNLKVSEAVLTGEWIPSLKSPKNLPKDTPLADRENMVYMGCLVEAGEGRAVVVSTGSKTEAGKIAKLLKETREEKTPLQEKLAHFSKTIGKIIGIICFLIFVGGIIREGHILDMFETSVAVAVGGIPESLPIVMTVVLAIGMERILRKKGLIRRLASVETLGSTEVICFDKTKTLTQGKMEFAKVIGEDAKFIFKIAISAIQAFIENPKDSWKEWRIKGDPTEIAILKTAARFGILKPELDALHPQLFKMPFDPTYKFQLSIRKEAGKKILYLLGAPDKLLEFALNSQKWHKELFQLAQSGFRVLGVAWKEIQNENFQFSEENIKEVLKNLHFEGLIALKDPIRPDVKEAIRVCQRAGMKPVMVTGDHRLTAIAIAKEIGIEVKEDEVLEGKDLDKMSREELEKKIEKIKIFARVEPRHKMKIISAWQAKGKVVAMTGDGINDAPALKKADIGIALGSGTEVAKEASDLILLNDSFSIIIKAVEEGRVIFDNIRKSISYVLADSFTSIILVGFAKIIFGWPLPILPAQILWNNFVEDSLPTIAYAFEPKEKGVMTRKPIPKKAPLLNREMKVLIFATGIIDQFIPLLMFWLLWKEWGWSLAHVRTLVFGAICLDTAFVVYSYKSLRKNLWQINPFTNKWLNISAILVIIFFVCAVYLPVFQKLLSTVPLGLYDWLILFLVGILSTFLVELTKWFFIVRQEQDL